tara:strand:- start:382 stop:1053 length:672 start_codon:yes stop_codon:yes gene_type:complete
MTTKQQRYRDSHKQKTLDYGNLYYENNKEKVLACKRQRLTCRWCLKSTTVGGLVAHLNTKKHKDISEKRVQDEYAKTAGMLEYIQAEERVDWLKIMSLENTQRSRFYTNQTEARSRLNYFKRVFAMKLLDIEHMYKVLEMDHSTRVTGRDFAFIGQAKNLHLLYQEFNKVTDSRRNNKIDNDLFKEWERFKNSLPVVSDTLYGYMGGTINVCKILAIYNTDQP